MKRKKNRFKSFLKSFVLKPMFLFFLALFILFSSIYIFSKVQYLQLAVSNLISSRYGYEISSLKMDIKPSFDSITFSLSDVKGLDTDTSSGFGFTSFSYSLSYSTLISGCIYPEFMEITGPRIIIRKTRPHDEGGGIKAALSSVYAFLESRLPGTLKAFILKDGAIDLDGFSIEDMEISLVRKGGKGNRADFAIKLDIRNQDARIPFKADGEFLYDDKGLESAMLNTSFSSLPISMIPWPESFRGTTGKIGSKGMRFEWQRGGLVASSGVLLLPQAGFMLDAYNELKSINLSGTEVRFEADILKNAVDIREFDIKGDDFNLFSSCYIPLEQGAKGMGLSVRSSMMPMQRFKALFPAPVTPTWIGTKLLPLFSGGNARLNKLIIEGSFGRISGLDNKENASSLYLNIDLDKIDIADFGGGLKSKNVSANVLLENGRLKITGVNGKIGSSMVRDSFYDYEDTYAEKSMENWHLDGKFSLKDLHTISKSKISPSVVREVADDIKETSGSLDGDISFSYYPDWKYIGITGGKVSSSGLSFVHSKAVYPFDLGSLSVSFDDKGKAEIDLLGSYGSSSGSINGWAEIFRGDLGLNGLALIDTEELVSMFDGKTAGKKRFAFEGKQRTTFRLNSSGWRMRLETHSSIEGLTGRLDHFILTPVKSDSYLSIELSQSKLGEWEMDGLELKMGKGVLGLAAPTGIGKFSQVSFSVKDFEVGNLGLFHEGNGLSFSGVVNGDILVKPGEEPFSYPGVFGEINLMQAGIRMKGLPLENKGTGKIIFSGQRVYTDNLKLGLGESYLDVFGDLRGWDGLKGEIGIKAKSLSMPSSSDEKASDEILPVLEGDFALKSDLKIDVDIDYAVTSENKVFGPVQATCIMKNGLFDIKDGKVGMPEGEIRYRLKQSESDRSSVTARAYIALDKQNLREAASYLNAEKYITVLDNALLSTDAYLYSSGRSKSELASNLGGYIHLSLEDGIVKKSSVIFKILSVLNLERFVHERPDGVAKEGFYFQNLAAGFKVKDGVFTTTDLVLKSPVMNLGAAGAVNLNNRTINLDVLASPLATIDSFVSHIPFVGYILTGKDKALLSYYFKVNGPLESPETSYIPLQKIPESVLGYLQRIFMTPGRIPEEFNDLKELILNKEPSE